MSINLKQMLFRLRCVKNLAKDNYFWLKHEMKYSSTLYSDERSDLAKLIINSHVLEKGITMPGRRLGFGFDRVRTIIKQCHHCIRQYGKGSIEVQATLKGLEEYLELHMKEKYELPKDIVDGITELLKHKIIDTKECYETTYDAFFAPTKDFSEFARQRHTLRWYNEKPVPVELVKQAVELAMTAPSACNRQSIKVYVVTKEEKKKEILDIQNGHRGFGQTADKILLVTADARCYPQTHRPMAYVDGGIFTMNLLYALHYHQIAACTLNACIPIQNRKRLCRVVGMHEAEFPIAFIAIGNPPEKFMVAASQRLNVERVVEFV